MNAAELRKKLDEGLRADSSGRSTPIQRLTPFLQNLVTYLEEQEFGATVTEKVAAEAFARAVIPDKVSSDDATRVVTAQTNNESDGAPKTAA